MNYLILTVDVEAPKGEGFDSEEPINNFIWGKSRTKDLYGIDRIMDLCDEHGVKGIFFVDVAEAWDYGKEHISQVMLHIAERGHEVGVHIHPNHMKDEKRFFLYEYSKNEQYEMIKKCTDLYTEVMGKKPSFFRAGKYSANYDTLDIVSDLGYKFDMSEFYGQKWCGINPPLTADKIACYKNLIEIPVTTFYSINLAGMRRIDKIDMEMPAFVHNYVVNSFAKGEGNVISLFLHSFSFMNWRESPNEPQFNERKYNNVRSILKHTFHVKNIKFISANDIEKLMTAGKVSIDGNNICQVSVKNPFISYRYILETSIRICKTNSKARYFILIHGIVIFVLLLAVILRIIGIRW